MPGGSKSRPSPRSPTAMHAPSASPRSGAARNSSREAAYPPTPLELLAVSSNQWRVKDTVWTWVHQSSDTCHEVHSLAWRVAARQRPAATPGGRPPVRGPAARHPSNRTFPACRLAAGQRGGTGKVKRMLI